MQPEMKRNENGRILQRMWRDRFLYLMIFPTVLYFLIFRVWPIFNMRLAFFEYKAKGPWQFVGLKYFKMIFSRLTGICGLYTLGLVIGSSRCASATVTVLSPSKGTRPVTISYMVMPNE